MKCRQRIVELNDILVEVEVASKAERDDSIPTARAAGLGAQLTVLIVAIPILLPTVVMRAAGTTDTYLSWAVFASVSVCGATTALQAVRYGRIGLGHVLVMSSSTAFIWPCIAAIERSGPGLLVTLVVISALLQFVLSALIVWFRRILTPTVSGMRRSLPGSVILRAAQRHPAPARISYSKRGAVSL